MAKEKQTSSKKIKSKSHKKQTKLMSESLVDKIKAERFFGLKNKYAEIAILSVIVAMAAFFLYFSTTDYGLVYCDDNIFVKNYSKDSSLTSTFDTTVGVSFYRPILYSSLILDAKSAVPDTVNVQNPSLELYKLPLEDYVDVSVYHTSNLIYHIIGSILVLLTLIKLRFNYLIATMLALLFAVHPLLTPAAAWISGRNDSMITIFILLSFITFINFLDIKKWAYSGIYFVLHIIAVFFALFTKETAAVTPLICFIYFLYYYKFGPKDKLGQKAVMSISAWVVLGGVWMWLRNSALSKLPNKNPDEIGFDAFIQNFNTIPALIGKIFLPYKMIALSSFETFSIITGWIVIIGIIAALYFTYKKLIASNRDIEDTKARKRIVNFKLFNIIFGLFWFIIFLVPTLFIRIQHVYDFFDYAEHRAYLPLLGILIIIAQMISINKINLKKPIAIAIFALFFVGFTYKSYTYKGAFQNRMTFWGHMTEMYPEKPRGYYDYALGFKVNKDTVSAEKEFLHSLKLNPNFQKTYYELLNIYDNQQRWDKVEEYARILMNIKQETRKDMNKAFGLYYLGKSYYSRGLKKEALYYLQKVVSRKSSTQWQVYLGDCYLEVKQFEKSMQALKWALAQDMNFPEANLYLGMNYYILKQAEKAKEYWDRALRFKPTLYLRLLEFFDKQKDPENVRKLAELWGKNEKNLQAAHYYFLAKSYLAEGNYDEAIKIVKDGRKAHQNKNLDLLLGESYILNKDPGKVLEMSDELIKKYPKLPEIYHLMARAQVDLKKYEDALESFNKAIKLNPKYSNAYDRKAAVLFAMNKPKEAEETLLKSIAENPENRNSFINLVRYYKKNKNEKEARKYARELRKLRGTIPDDIKMY